VFESKNKNNRANTKVFTRLLVRRKGRHIALQSAWLGDPRLRLRYPPAPLFAKNSTLYCFLNAQTLSGFESLLNIRITEQTQKCSLGYWYAGRDGILLCNLHGLATQGYAFGTRLHRSSLKTVHCTVFLTLRPSQGSSPFSI